MPYTKRPDITVRVAGFVALELDSGELVAAACELMRCPNSHNVVVRPMAIAIDAYGDPISDSHGEIIAVEHRHSCCDTELDRAGEAAIKREALLLVLGEPPTLVTPADGGEPEQLIPWPGEIRASASIRRALRASAAAGIAGDVSELL
ncbi:hypothetical protein [Hydrocarboniphaga sp.]|uniref:hypothetical protein n=1 Tax=Hydrocarboniphaga sp. TaxID=2033016 RepID=UPI003D0E9FAB